MSDKRKKRKFETKREKRKLRQLWESETQSEEGEFLKGAVPADPDQQVPNNSYDAPPVYYIDIEFACIDCGRREVWTGHQQKWYYEVAKGSLYATAVRCRACRRDRKEGRNPPNRIQNIGTIVNRIRCDLEPSILEAGFQYDGLRSGRKHIFAGLSYSRPDLTLLCQYNQRDVSLIAEVMNNEASCQTIANTELFSSLPPAGLHMTRVDEFISKVQVYLQTLDVTENTSNEEV